MKSRLLRLATTMYLSAGLGYVFLTYPLLYVRHGNQYTPDEKAWSEFFAIEAGAMLGLMVFLIVHRRSSIGAAHDPSSDDPPPFRILGTRTAIGAALAIFLVYRAITPQPDYRLVGTWRGAGSLLTLAADGTGSWSGEATGAFRWTVKNHHLLLQRVMNPLAKLLPTSMLDLIGTITQNPLYAAEEYGLCDVSTNGISLQSADVSIIRAGIPMTVKPRAEYFAYVTGRQRLWINLGR